MIRLSVIVPSLTGEVPQSLKAQAAGRADVEIVAVVGVSPVGKARNEGLRRARGEYIAWVDADDDIEADWCEEILRAIEKGPDVIVIGHRWMVTDDFGFEKTWSGGDLLKDVLRQEKIFGELWNKIARRELWNGILFDDAARTMEDWDVLPRLLLKARKVLHIERSLYLYRRREDSLTNLADASLQREIVCHADRRLDLMKSLGLWNRYGRETLIGCGYVVYCAGEMTALRCGRASGKAVLSEIEGWLRNRFWSLMATDARLTYKVKWLLGATGLWQVARVFYRLRGGRR